MFTVNCFGISTAAELRHERPESGCEEKVSPRGSLGHRGRHSGYRAARPGLPARPLVLPPRGCGGLRAKKKKH